MDKYGIDNVRGGSYSSVVLDTETKKQLIKISNNINNRCFICGKRDGHFAKECVYNNNNNANDATEQHTSATSTSSLITSKYDYIMLQTLLTDTPAKMLVNISDLDIIKKIKVIRIKLGDSIILNYKKSEYSSLKELVEDAINIFDKYNDADIAKIPNITSIEHAKSLRQYLLPCKINLYKNIAELLGLLSPYRCKLLQSGCLFQEIENIIIQSL
jgi:hypothetical protein